MSDDTLTMHREAVKDNFALVRGGIEKTQTAVSEVREKVASGFADLNARIATLESAKTAAEKRISDLEARIARLDAYIGIAVTVIPLLISIIATLITRAVMR